MRLIGAYGIKLEYANYQGLAKVPLGDEYSLRGRIAMARERDIFSTQKRDIPGVWKNFRGLRPHKSRISKVVCHTRPHCSFADTHNNNDHAMLVQFFPRGKA